MNNYMEESESDPPESTPKAVLLEETEKTEQTRLRNRDSDLLRAENAELRRENQRLSRDLEELASKLEVELSKQPGHSPSTASELSNCQKLLLLYKREIKSLRRQVLSSPQRKLVELSTVLKSKDSDIEALKSEVKSLKRLNAYQQKGLVQAAGEGVIDCIENYDQLAEEHRRLQRRCDDYERQLRKKSTSSKVVEVHAQEDIERLEVYARQVELLKLIEGKNKKQIYHLTKEVERVRDDKNKYLQELREKDRELQKSQFNVMEIRKFAARPRRVDERELEESGHLFKPHHSRIKTLPELPESPQRNYRPSYPKVECRGETLPKSVPWTHTKFSSRMVEVHLAIDSHNKINEVHCKYEKGSPDRVLGERAEYSSFRCRENEYVHLISGGFSNQLLDFLVFVTSEKRKIKFGVESRNSTKFDFNIQENEYPCAMFGEMLQEEAGWRINKIGCLIQRL